MEKPVRVGIIEDDPQIRQLMQLIIDGSPGFSCLQVWESCERALPDLKTDCPDVLLMDIDLPGMSGIEGVGELRKLNPQLPVVMLTIHDDNEAVFDSLCAGAVGYLVKGLPPVQLLAAIREAHAGGSPMSAAIARKVVRSFETSRHNPLSDREQEVLSMLCDGENYRTIAEALFISVNTVKAHIKNIYEKLQVHTRADAVRTAIRNRLIK
ncbi:MAG: response regulator transcription factor [Saprospiraceae bacterium]